MERFNLSFRRKGYFYMEGEVSVDFETEGPALLKDVIDKAHTKKFTRFIPKDVQYFDDEWVFGRTGPGSNPDSPKEVKEEAVDEVA